MPATTRKPEFALVTGCGRGGIGEALVKEYARRGLHPIATVLPHENSDHLSEAGITFFPLDVTVEKSVLDLHVEVQKLTGGHLDILVNCAGIAYTMTAIDTDVEAVKRMFDINVFGPMRMVHHFHPMLIAAKGAIVNIGSIGGIIPFLYGSSYNASKAALAHWGNTLRLEMKPFDVKVITVISGEVSTNILKSDANRTLPEGSFYTPIAQNFEQHVNRTPGKSFHVQENGHHIDGATDRFKYATNVVSMSLRPAPPAWFWYGSFTVLTRFLDTFGWRTVWDSILWNMFGLEKLKVAHQSPTKKVV
ncbi:short-chain dehydrogenase/reductase [Apiospora marii]|uniref:Short-chain dehydrogenase/reductase n=1 Tax=Apiospora marii TaxID=335849 RepID=A0ABR1SU27_9PEZI